MKKVLAEEVGVLLAVEEVAAAVSVADLVAVGALRAAAGAAPAAAAGDGTAKSTRLWQSYCRILENIHVSLKFFLNDKQRLLFYDCFTANY